MEEVAELPFQIDIQLFADDEDIDGDGEEVSKGNPFFDLQDDEDADDKLENDEDTENDTGDTDTEDEEEADSEDDIDEEDKGTDEEEPDEAEKQEVADPEQEKPKQDPKTNKIFQNMRHELEEAKKYKAALEEAARVSGFDTVEAYTEAVEKAKREKEAKKYQEAANDPDKLMELVREEVRNLPEYKEAQQTRFENEMAKQKREFEKNKYFAALESEVDKLVKSQYANGKPVDYKTAFTFLAGKYSLNGKFDELLAKEKENVKKSTIADIADKQKRSAGNIKSDGSAASDIAITKEIKEMAADFGISPKQLAARLAKKNS